MAGGMREAESASLVNYLHVMQPWGELCSPQRRNPNPVILFYTRRMFTMNITIIYPAQTENQIRPPWALHRWCSTACFRAARCTNFICRRTMPHVCAGCYACM